MIFLVLDQKGNYLKVNGTSAQAHRKAQLAGLDKYSIYRGIFVGGRVKDGRKKIPYDRIRRGESPAAGRK